ncbi:MAG: DUF1579 family protein [Acidobacteria bacterium]|nr:DUF1579 family protein [Acidobacteriota bacterium]
MKTKIVSLLASLLVASSLLAANADPNLAKLEGFVGKWTCSGTDMSSGKSMASWTSVNSRWGYDGKWVVVDLDQTKPMALKATAFLGYDAGARMYVLGYLDSMAGYGTAWSKGWDGNTMTFEGDMHMMGMAMKGRDVFVKDGMKLQHSVLVEEKGTWKKLMEETCSK